MSQRLTENGFFEQNAVSSLNFSTAFIRPHQTKQQALVRVVDSCIVLLSLWLTIFVLNLYWSGKYDWNNLYMTYAFVGLLLFQFFAEYNEVYYSWRGAPLSTQLFRIIGSWLLTLATMLLLFFFTRSAVDTSRLIIGIWSVSTVFLLT